MTNNIDVVKENISKIKKAWKKDMKKPYGGGLDSVTNQKLIQLKLALKLLEKAEERKNKPQSKH